MVGIHHLAWVDNLDAGAVVLVQRHEDRMAARVNSSMDPSRTELDSYITVERLEPSGWLGSTWEMTSSEDRIRASRGKVMQVVQ